MLAGATIMSTRGAVVEATPSDINDTFLTTDELAAMLRTDTQTLANLRARGDGIPWCKPTGKVLYKVSDVLDVVNGSARGFTRERLKSAISTFRGITPEQKRDLFEHITEALRG